MKKKIIQIIGIVFFLFLGWRIIALFTKGSGGSERRTDRPPVAVEVDSVRFESIQGIREFTGTVFSMYQYVVAPKVSGRILEMRKRIDWAVPN